LLNLHDEISKVNEVVAQLRKEADTKLEKRRMDEANNEDEEVEEVKK
jgi:hypothetical protein